jgi:hypothetical protein
LGVAREGPHRSSRPVGDSRRPAPSLAVAVVVRHVRGRRHDAEPNAGPNAPGERRTSLPGVSRSHATTAARHRCEG